MSDASSKAILDANSAETLANGPVVLSPEPELKTSRIPDADIRHNIKMLILVDCLWVLGATEMQLAAGPLYVHLKLSNTLIGLIGSLQALAVVGVIVSPFITRHFPIKKYYLFFAHFPYLAPWGLIGLALIFSDKLGLSNAWLSLFVVAMMGTSAFFCGFTSLPHNEYVAACVPMSHRGRLSGYANTAGAALALISNALAGWILFTVPKPMAFGWLYLMTWIICQSGYIFALFARESRTPVEHSPKPWSREMIAATLQDRCYVRVVLLNSLYILFFVPVTLTFLSVYGFRELGLIPAAAASIGIVQKIVSLLTATKIGHLIDRVTPKRILMFTPVLLVVTLLPVIVWKNPAAIYISSALGVLFTICFQTPFNALFAGLPKPENRAGHYTFQMLVSYMAWGVGPILIGTICDALGYRQTFTLLAALGCAMIPFSKWILSPLSDKSEHYN